MSDDEVNQSGCEEYIYSQQRDGHIEAVKIFTSESLLSTTQSLTATPVVFCWASMYVY